MCICFYVCIHVLWLIISSFQGRQRAVSRLGVVIESLPVSRAGDRSRFLAAFSFEKCCKAYQHGRATPGAKPRNMGVEGTS